MSYTSTLNPALIDRAFRKTPIQTTKTPATFPYDAARYDKPIERMFGRRWSDDMEVFLPRSKEIWSALFRCTIGGTFSLDEVQMLLAVAQNTGSENLRYRALGGLRDYVADCSGTSTALKPAAQTLLDTLTPTALPTVLTVLTAPPATATPKETDV